MDSSSMLQRTTDAFLASSFPLAPYRRGVAVM